jgi:hypothetical protein
MDEIKQSASWPGVAAVEACSGTISHGVTPSRWVLTTYPQAASPEMFGNLTITDEVNPPLTLRNCKVDGMVGRAGADGQTFSLEILDRRFAWSTGAISGRYNQTDPRGKLIPWTIRSPKEIAKLCLDAAGEKNYLLFLPDGLKEADGRNFNLFLQLGENFPQSLANPPVNWEYVPPMVALQQFVSQFGCRVVWQPVTDRVVVVPVGVGSPLPEGPCEAITPNLDSPETPQAVAVAGAPMRIQMKLLLEPVAEEHDGSYVPVNDVSYAPRGSGTTQQTTVTWSGVTANPSVKVFITYTPPGGGGSKTVAYEYSDAVPASDKFIRIVLRINADPEMKSLFKASASGDVLTIEGRKPGFTFGVRAETSSPAPDKLTVATPRKASSSTADWSFCRPPNFRAVVATDRLSYQEAIEKARRSVYRCYRVVDADANTGKYPIKVPYYTTVTGKPLKRRQQLVLQQTKVALVEPAPRLPGGRNRGVPGNPLIQILGVAGGLIGGIFVESYNGYERDQKAVVYGSVSRRVGQVMWDPGEYNSPANGRVFAEFSIDPIEQVVTFAEPVWKAKITEGGEGDDEADSTDGYVAFPALVLETAVLVTDQDTGALYRWTKQEPLGGVAPAEWSVHEDIQIGVVTEYDDANAVRNTRLTEEADAHKRADYYLRGMASRYLDTGGETRQYIGIVAHDLDGYCQQASYSVGPGGATTVLSGNCEHSDVIPNYPARQRAEALPPNAFAVLANKLSQPAAIPKAPGDPR